MRRNGIVLLTVAGITVAGITGGIAYVLYGYTPHADEQTGAAVHVTTNKESYAEDNTIDDGVEIITDNTSYAQAETVQIEIRNTSDSRKNIGIYYGIEILDDKKWVGVNNLVCPCGMFCELADFWLKPGEIKRYTWNQREEWCVGRETMSEQVPSGTYRIAVNVLDYLKRKTVYSKDFLIR